MEIESRAPLQAQVLVRPELARDAAWSLLVAVLLALSPLTGSARLLPSIALGALGGALVFGLRRRRPRPLPARAGLPISLGAPGLALVLGVAAVFAPTLAWLYAQSTDSIWRHAHGLFVPVFVFLLARSALRRDSRGGEESSAWGFAFLVPALALAVVDAAVRSQQLAAIGLVLALPGLSLLRLGARRTRALALALGAAVFAVPIPGSFETPLGLPAMTAAGMEPLLEAVGVPAVRHSSSFQLSGGWLGISRNCSGLATLHAALALGVLLAATGRSRLRRLLPLLLALPLTLAANVVRGVAFAFLCERLGHDLVLASPIHGLSGIGVFWLVIAGVWLAGDRAALREALT